MAATTATSKHLPLTNRRQADLVMDQEAGAVDRRDALRLTSHSDTNRPSRSLRRASRTTTASKEKLRPAPFFYYKDHSRVPDKDPLTLLTPIARVPNFPAKMYAILAHKDFSYIVGWMPNGRSWKIHKPREFELVVLPVYFDHAKLGSFVRQARGWGFRMLSHGPDKNSYYNELFLRGLPHLCKAMKRSGTSQKIDINPEHEPDLYEISRLHPLPEKASEDYDESVRLDFTVTGGPKARMPICSFGLVPLKPKPATVVCCIDLDDKEDDNNSTGTKSPPKPNKGTLPLTKTTSRPAAVKSKMKDSLPPPSSASSTGQNVISITPWFPKDQSISDQQAHQQRQMKELASSLLQSTLLGIDPWAATAASISLRTSQGGDPTNAGVNDETQQGHQSPSDVHNVVEDTSPHVATPPKLQPAQISPSSGLHVSMIHNEAGLGSTRGPLLPRAPAPMHLVGLFPDPLTPTVVAELLSRQHNRQVQEAIAMLQMQQTNSVDARLATVQDQLRTCPQLGSSLGNHRLLPQQSITMAQNHCLLNGGNNLPLHFLG